VLTNLSLCYGRCSRVRDLSPPWLLFIAENGIGKRVPLNAFRQSNFNAVGLQGYKVWSVYGHQFLLPDIYIFFRSILKFSAFGFKTEFLKGCIMYIQQSLGTCTLKLWVRLTCLIWCILFCFAASRRLSFSRCICCWSFTQWYHFWTCFFFLIFNLLYSFIFYAVACELNGRRRWKWRAGCFS
jgi:hypothetical protein